MKRNIVKLILIQGVVIILLVGILGEIFVRVTKKEYVTPEILKQESFEYEPAVFSRSVFPRKVQQFWGTPQWHRSKRYINALGYRGKGFSREKPAGVTRIIVYGGSSVFDLALSEGEDWPHKLEKILKDNGFPQVEVINAGIPGHASFDVVGRFFTEGHLFSPDYVVFYGEWNDLKNFASDEPLLRQIKPLEVDDNPLLNYNSAWDQFWCEHSQLYVRLRDGYYRKKLNVTPEGSAPKPKQSYDFKESALNQYRLDLEMFADIARNIGATPIFVTEGRFATESNQKNGKFWYAHRFFPHTFIVEAFAKGDKIIFSVAQEKKVKVIDASKELTGVEKYFEDHIHLTPEGSAFLAQIVAVEILPLLKKDQQINLP